MDGPGYNEAVSCRLQTMALMAVVALPACGQRTPTPPRLPPARVAIALDGICAAVDLSMRNRVRGAATVFENEAHDQLHVIAAKVEKKDRAAAARLLETKELVEAAFRERERAPRVTRLLERLQRAAATAARILDEEFAACPEAA